MNSTDVSAPTDADDNRAWPPAMRWMLSRRLLLGIVLALAVSFAIAGWSPGFPMVYTLLRSIGMWLLNGVLLGCLYCVAAHWLARQPWMPSAWVALGAGGAVALLGYVSFWVWFAHPVAGHLFSIAAVAFGIRLFLRTRPRFDARDREWISVTVTMAIVGLLHLGILHQFGARQGFLYLAYDRFIDHFSLGQDNLIPHEFNVQLGKGDCRVMFLDWLYSDRPPLQTGWQSLTWPLASLLRLNDKFVTGLAGFWFQLLWVAAAYGLFRWLRLNAARALAWCGVLAMNGFFLLNTTFTWPKLGAAAFACGAFALWAQPPSPHRHRQILAGGVLVALAWLSHGGVAFSLVPLAPWLMWRALRGEMKSFAVAGTIFIALAMPWTAFQKFYAPPGNRLLKWHLGGQIEVDPRGVGETIRSAYAKLSWGEIAANKAENFRMQFKCNWGQLADLSLQRAYDRRLQEFWFTGTALTWWKFTPALLLAAFAAPGGRRRLAALSRRTAAVAVWVAATLVVWCLLLFPPKMPNAACVIVGSYAMFTGMFVLLSAVAESAGRWPLPAIAALQAITLLTTWAVPYDQVSGPLSAPALVLMLLGGAGIAWLLLRAHSDKATQITDA